MFDVGQKVVCVDDKFPQFVVVRYPELPKKDKVYVVRDIVPAQNGKGSGTIAVLLVGIRPHINDVGTENGFAHTRFVPLDEFKDKKKTIKL